MAPPRNANRPLFLAVLGAALLLLLAVIGTRLARRPAPPPPPPPPTQSPRPATQVLRQSPGYYQALLEEDAGKAGLPVPTVLEMGAPFVHTVELDGRAPRLLAPGQSFDTAHLRLTVVVDKLWAQGPGGQGFRFDHLVLRIENLTDRHLAYRVDTDLRPSDDCAKRGALPHDAMVLLPGATIRRSECLYHPKQQLVVTGVEVVALPPLAARYASRLDPSLIGLDPRPAAGHVPVGGPICRFIPWRDLEADGAAFRDVVDFYGRHNCDEYTFVRGHRVREAPGPLPIVAPPDLGAPAGR